MLKLAYVVLGTAAYADTLVAVVGAIVLALLAEGEAWREPAFSLCLQVLGGLVGAHLLRQMRELPLWTVEAMLSSSEAPHGSLERTMMAGAVYLSALPYNRRTSDDFPVGIYGAIALLAVIVVGFDVLLRIYAGEHGDRARRLARAKQRHTLHDDPDEPLPAHRHKMRSSDFYGIGVLCAAAVFIAYPDIVITCPRWLDALLPPALLLATCALSLPLGWLLKPAG